MCVMPSVSSVAINSSVLSARQASCRTIFLTKCWKIIREWGGGCIGVSPMCGEALLDPKLLPRIEAITSSGLATCFCTNGLALHKIDLDRLVRSGVSPVYVSTAPMDAQSLALIYRVHDFDHLIEGIVGLLSARRRLQSNLRVEIHFRSHLPKRDVLRRPVFRERIWPLLTDVERQCIQVQIVAYDSWGGMIKPADLPGRMRLALPSRLRRRPCNRLFQPMVMYDGQVRLCACRFGPSNVADDRDALVIGNVREASLHSILDGTRARELRRSFIRGTMPVICRDCAHYEPC